MRIRGVAAVLLSALAASAAAGELYRCQAADGSLSYTNTRPGGQDCKVIQRYTPAPARGGGTPAAPRVDFRSVPGDAAPRAPAVSGQARVTRGAVYKYERDGVVHYTNVRPRGEPVEVLFTYVETCFACAVRPGVDFRTVPLNTSAFAAEVAKAASEFGVDEALVRAVMHAESAFNPNARSHKGAQGLMQLIPATAERFGVADPFDAAQNIRGGVEYLAWLLRRFDGNTTLATAAYNAGEGAVDRYGGVPPFAETQRYVERVAILFDRYRSRLAATY
ncbi:lytic transglycosylase domain-containing protein [Rehaibacterium terrae]|jgi:soluble lytic murein transglycosylase-like protein|uniref:Soluble lytic murein transglycosylase-like protein n=1 Tax=Rehaibacterium terrae TaxID=1341696 RepID=A0A7W8DDI2_9GAMM|nr:lytic transglycosylase domain-containing protein [Rehaibacterium terrae]MBB5015165.1 soluble lytic murein transglycosylase-like protein [Rehaibacterium terrae]